MVLTPEEIEALRRAGLWDPITIEIGIRRRRIIRSELSRLLQWALPCPEDDLPQGPVLPPAKKP
jgi:hypothetical protein